MHRGWLYPAALTAVWTRDDGLQVELRIVVTKEIGPTVTEATIRRVGGAVLSVSDGRQPFAAMAKQAAAEVALKQTADKTFALTTGGQPVPMGPVKTRTTAERLERVAELYRRAEAEGGRVTTYILETEPVSESQAYSLIQQARRAGLLPPSRPGRKAKR